MSLGNLPRIQRTHFLFYSTFCNTAKQKNDAAAFVVLMWQNGLVLLHFFIAG
jgi:hypothetical protein